MNDQLPNPSADEIVNKLALKDLAASFNEIAARHGLLAKDACEIILAHAASTIAKQFVSGSNKKAFRRQMVEDFDNLLKHFMPRLEV